MGKRGTEYARTERDLYPTPNRVIAALAEHVELNAMTSDALIEMIERKLKAYGLKKVIPDGDLLGKAYRASHHSKQLREKFEQIEDEFEAPEIEIPRNLKEQVSAVLDEHGDLRWDDAIQIVLDKSQLDRVRAEKQKAKGSSKRKSSPSLHDGRTR